MLPDFDPNTTTPSCSCCSCSGTPSEGERMQTDTSSPTTVIHVDSISPAPNPSMEHFKQSHILIHRLGAGDNGETYTAITKDHANRMLSLKRLGHALDLATEDIIVVKFYKPDNLGGDLSNEITFMKDSLVDTHDLLTHAVESHHDGEIQWLALPYCNGGTLESFIQKHPTAISTAFIWHVGLQLIKAACYLHFGIQEVWKDEEVSGWPIVYHADIYPCNILLRGGGDNPCQFPDVVIADFGRATDYCSDKFRNSEQHCDCELCQSMFVQRQAQDMRCIAGVMWRLRQVAQGLECTCRLKDCTACQERYEAGGPEEVLDLWIEDLWSSEEQIQHRLTDVLGFLKKFVVAGNAELLRNRQPMPPVTNNFFYGRNLKCGSIFEALADFEAHDPAAHQISKYFEHGELPLMTAESQRAVILRALHREAGESLPGRYNAWTDLIVELLAMELDDAALLGLLCDEQARTAAVMRQLGLLLVAEAYPLGTSFVLE